MEKTNEELDEYYDDLLENSVHESCPNCGNDYDDVDFDFQICHICKWDAENERFTK